MTQEQLDALLAEVGGGRLSYAPAVETKKIPNPNRLDADGTIDYSKPKEIEVTIQRWHDPASGRVIEAYQGAGGWTVTRNSTDKSLVNVGATPETQAPRSAADQRTAREEAEIARNADPKQTPVDPRSETDAQRADRAAATIKEQGAAARQAQADAEAKAERDRVAARQAQADADAKAKAAAEAGKPSITIKPIKQPDGSTKNVQVRVYPDGREEVVPSAVPGEPAPAQPAKPKYTSVQQDKDTGKWFGLKPDGTWEEMQGGPGATPTTNTTRAPSMPQFIVGQSQDALRQAYDDIQAEVDAGRRTPAWGENRRKEVYETAQLTVNEAHLHEQSRQFNQSQAYNVANARMNNQQGVLEFALRSALSINGKIKKGSSAGAELFRGLFNLGLRMQADSGINNIRPGGGQSSIPGAPGARGAPGQPARAGQSAQPGRATTRPPMDIGDAKALAAHADQEAANIQAGLEASGAPRERTPVADSTLPLPVRDGVPVTSTPAPAAPDPGHPENMSTMPWFTPTGATPPVVAPEPPAAPPPAPQAVTPPEPQFAAMEPYRMKTPQIDPLAAQAMDPMQGMGEMPAALSHTQIASTPPWLLPQDRLADLVGQYGEDAVFGYPGMPRSEVMA